jgi:hypothetical protein
MVTQHDTERDLIDKAWQLIIPDEAEKRRLCDGGQVLVHNTSPENAKNILKKPELWLRNARDMQDKHEVRLGRDCVNRFLANRAFEIAPAIEAISPGVWDEISECWNSEIETQINRTYIACFNHALVGEYAGSTRHWNAYGDVAFHFDPAFMAGEPAALGLYLVKVVYGKDHIEQGLADLLTTLKRHRDRFAAIPRATLVSLIRHRLFFISVASKSDEYAWENEWRLIHTPHLFASVDIQKEFVGDGEAQSPIYPLPLRNTQDGHNPLLCLPSLIRNILIRSSGSSVDQELRHDLIRLLKYHGVPDSDGRVLLHRGP